MRGPAPIDAAVCGSAGAALNAMQVGSKAAAGAAEEAGLSTLLGAILSLLALAGGATAGVSGGLGLIGSEVLRAVMQGSNYIRVRLHLCTYTGVVSSSLGQQLVWHVLRYMPYLIVLNMLACLDGEHRS